MNVARVFELAETATDAELVWLIGRLSSRENENPAQQHDLMIFHRLYSQKITTIITAWHEQGINPIEMAESVEEMMTARLEA
jgi:hypothetical protein